MDVFSMLMAGFAVSLSPSNLIAALGGSVLGIVIGAIPGLGSVTAIALLLPLTFGFDPTTAIIMLAAVYFGCMFGGAFSAILINIPGDSAAIITAVDGYPMTQRGHAGKALFAANFSSFVGSSVAVVILSFTGPALASLGLRFGPAETALLVLVALTSIGWLLGESPAKGLAATALGVMLATIGMGVTYGDARFSMGSMYLMSGMPFIPLVVGMFGFSQVMEMAMGPREIAKGLNPGMRGLVPEKGEVKALMPVALRSGLLGTFIGVIPGAGATIGSFFAYVLESRVGRNRAQLGKGCPEGVAAAEAGNNAAAVGSFAPLLSLGIPGSGSTAVLLGGLMMWGLQPGPMLFQSQPEFVWGLISSMYVACILGIIASFAILPFIMRILTIPIRVLIPVIAVTCIIATYSLNSNMVDVWLMLGTGVLAWGMRLSDYPIAPLLLAFVLTPNLEANLSRSFDISAGSWSVFVGSPIAIVLVGVLALIFATLGLQIYNAYRRKGAEVQPAAGE